MTSSDSNVTTAPGERGEPAVEEAFDRLLAEGSDRLDRPILALAATGFLGGVDIGVGVLAYLVVDQKTGQPLLGALAFTIGFIALLLARSELFTENFLVPVTARVAGHGSWFQLARLWLITLAANLAGGLLMAAMIVVALPEVRPTAASLGRHYATLGVSWRSLLLAVLAGAVITLLTRMQHAGDDLGPKIVAAIAMPFVLVAAQLFHSVLDSIVMFTGLLSGRATYTWADWAGALGWSTLGNVIGGVGLVTSIRLLRVPHRVIEERTSQLPGTVGRPCGAGWPPVGTPASAWSGTVPGALTLLRQGRRTARRRSWVCAVRPSSDARHFRAICAGQQILSTPLTVPPRGHAVTEIGTSHWK